MPISTKAIAAFAAAWTFIYIVVPIATMIFVMQMWTR